MRFRKPLLLALAISLTPLNACGTAPSDHLCLPVRAYSHEEQAAVASELERLGPQSVTGTFMADYGTLRDQARAMCK